MCLWSREEAGFGTDFVSWTLLCNLLWIPELFFFILIHFSRQTTMVSVNKGSPPFFFLFFFSDFPWVCDVYMRVYARLHMCGYIGAHMWTWGPEGDIHNHLPLIFQLMGGGGSPSQTQSLPMTRRWQGMSFASLLWRPLSGLELQAGSHSHPAVTWGS